MKERPPGDPRDRALPVIVARSLGCLAALQWAAGWIPRDHVAGVLLVAVPDPAGPELPADARSFADGAVARLGVPSVVVASPMILTERSSTPHGWHRGLALSFVKWTLLDISTTPACWESGRLDRRSSTRWSSATGMTPHSDPPHCSWDPVNRSLGWWSDHRAVHDEEDVHRPGLLAAVSAPIEWSGAT